MFKKLFQNESPPSAEEEPLYEQALSEIETGNVRKGLWAKSLADSDGDEAATKAIYLRYRVKSLLEENAAEALHAETAAQRSSSLDATVLARGTKQCVNCGKVKKLADFDLGDNQYHADCITCRHQ